MIKGVVFIAVLCVLKKGSTLEVLKKKMAKTRNPAGNVPEDTDS